MKFLKVSEKQLLRVHCIISEGKNRVSFQALKSKNQKLQSILLGDPAKFVFTSGNRKYHGRI